MGVMAVSRRRPVRHQSRTRPQSICEFRRIGHLGHRNCTRSGWFWNTCRRRGSHLTNLPHPRVYLSRLGVGPP